MKHRTSDVIIVGAGVSGLSIAVHLKDLGVRKVTVLERHFVGAGQSGRAAGVVRALVNHTGVASMLMESLGFFQTFHEKYGERIPALQMGYLLIDEAQRAGNMNRVLQNAAAAGCEAKRISHAQANELQPGLRLDSDDIYAFEPAAIYLDPMLTTQTLAKVARRMGVEIEQGCEVGPVISGSSHVQGVETVSGRFLAEKVVVATSVLGAAQLQKAGIDAPVYPHRAEMAFFAVFPESPQRLLRIVSDARTLLYLRPDGTDQMFVGWREGDRISTLEDLAAVDPENYRQTSQYASLADMQRRLIRTLPFMAEGFVHRTYACVYDYTPDGMPILDEAAAMPGLYFALGFSGGGFSLSPWVGSAMARFIVTGVKSPQMQLLRLSRFREGQFVSWANSVREKEHA